MAIHVVNEAKRCLNCKNPLCQTGCPINTPIPDMIRTFLSGNINDAGEMIFENNPLSLVCSLICNHESQCEGHCILKNKSTPVHISSIEHYISDTYFEKLELNIAPKNGMRAAVIGSGPAGITIAILLARRGYDITIFESRDKIGGVLRYGIPEFRLPKSILERYKKLLLSIGIKIRPNTSIGSVISIDDMFRDGYKAISIGTGVWKPNTLGIKGETLGNVHYAINYLTNPDTYNLGDNVIVLSGLNIQRLNTRR
jgi:glutamate synthase (NADPH/NADH) small chain